MAKSADVNVVSFGDGWGEADAEALPVPEAPEGAVDDEQAETVTTASVAAMRNKTIERGKGSTTSIVTAPSPAGEGGN